MTPDKACQCHNKLFADRINSRIRDLGEHLLKIIEKRLGLFRKHRDRCIRTHRCCRLLRVHCHGHYNIIDIFPVIGMQQVKLMKLFPRYLRRFASFRNILNIGFIVFDPFPVRPLLRNNIFYLFIRYDPTLLHIHQQKLSGRQAAFVKYVFRLKCLHTDFRTHHD